MNNPVLTETGSARTQDRIQRSNIRWLVSGTKAFKWGREGWLKNLHCFQDISHVTPETNSLKKTGKHPRF